MFREVRRKTKEISKDEARGLLKTNRRAALSMNGEDGYPYVIPINFYYEESENKIYFHSAKVGFKIEMLKACDKICLTSWDDGYLEEGDWAYHVASAVVFGRAKLVEDPEKTEEKIRKFALKYYPTAEEVEEEIKADIKAVQLVEIDIEHITGKRITEK